MNDFTITDLTKIVKATGRDLLIGNGGNEISFNKVNIPEDAEKQILLYNILL